MYSSPLFTISNVMIITLLLGIIMGRETYRTKKYNQDRLVSLSPPLARAAFSIQHVTSNPQMSCPSEKIVLSNVDKAMPKHMF